MVWRANYNIGVLFYGFGLLGLVHLFQVFKIIFSTFQAIKPKTENIMVIISQCSHLVSRRTGAAMIANNNNPLFVKLQVMRNPVRADESSHQPHNTRRRMWHAAAAAAAGTTAIGQNTKFLGFFCFMRGPSFQLWSMISHEHRRENSSR